MFEAGQKLQNIHTGDIGTIDHVEMVPISSPTDLRPAYCFTDGTRRNEKSMAHWKLLLEEKN